ncbi:Methyltransferase domain-containing protein [Paraburkholderia fungorum]|uniref:Methyltransferase domain-containing protein n=1 Tax=Paraburkholderia fungorum TaxID=134537 RepID=A0A1H0ZZ89_9BURK|nr:methyltransferase domain-containing protein [Paraburkholderia fungorum]SDQ32710.1 Methyltransferase domain-containing protein [Paraburkholderia fungorum]
MRNEDDGLEALSYRDKRRYRLLRGLNIQNSVGVEIGALCWPLVRRSDGGSIIYVDHADTPHLQQKYKDDPNVAVNEIVDVDAIWGQNSLHEAINGRYVDYVVASHVVEHVPDLVTWLRELAAVLKPTGEVRLVVPDRRFTFDYFRRESGLPEVLASYIERARVPHPYSILDFCLNAVDVNALDAWQRRIGTTPCRLHHTWEGALHLARDSFENGTYHDVHCWVFTPRTFARLIKDLCGMNLLDYACEGFRDTARNEIEFSVVLRRSRDREYIAESWRRMEEAAHDAAPGVPFWRVHRKLKEMTAEATGTAPATRVSGQKYDLDALEPIAFPPDFDPVDYLAANPDVREAEVDPVSHYRHYGWREGRQIRPSTATTTTTTPSPTPSPDRTVVAESK